MAPSQLDLSQQRWVIEALEKYEGRLVSYALRLTGDEHTARDVVQHAFLRLCDQTPESIRHGVGAWLYAVCRNRVIDLRRKEGRMEAMSEQQQVACRSPEPGPAEKCEVSDTGQQLRRIVGSLSEEQREVVDLWSEGFSYREISRITERKENTIRVQVHRALKQIRQHPLVGTLLAESADVVAES